MPTPPAMPRAFEPLLAQLREHLDRYDDIQYLDQGGMSVVFTGVNRGLERLEVIKVPFLHGTPEERTIGLFRRECRLLAKVSEHPNIVTIFHAEYDAELQLAWMSEAFIDGTDLAKKIGRGAGATSLPYSSCFDIALKLLSALGAAHAHGIIHRDVKPHNVLLDQDGGVFLADFGIAGLRDGSHSTLSQQGAGSPHYMSPEQTVWGQLDERSDLYSFGLLLFELFTGRQQFQGSSTSEVCRMQRESKPVPPSIVQPEIPRELDELILQLLAKKPADRPRSTAEVAERLVTIREGWGEAVNEASLPATQPLPGETRSVHWPRLRPKWLAIFAAAVAIVIALTQLPRLEVPRFEAPHRVQRGSQDSGTNQLVVDGTPPTDPGLQGGNEAESVATPDSIAQRVEPTPPKLQRPSPPQQPTTIRMTVAVSIVSGNPLRHEAQRARVFIDGRQTVGTVPGEFEVSGLQGESVEIRLERRGLDFGPPQRVQLDRDGGTKKVQFDVSQTVGDPW